ncbi:MAG: hypothetical protein HUK05_04830 [Prevotella sp.]|nr:hypothetical protein [Prevotella sp.]
MFIRGKLVPKFQYSKELAFRPQVIKQLSEVQNSMLAGLKVSFNADSVDNQQTQEFISLIKSFPGKHELVLELRTADDSRPLTIRSSQTKVEVNNKLIDQIEALGVFHCDFLWN